MNWAPNHTTVYMLLTNFRALNSKNIIGWNVHKINHRSENELYKPGY